jgi:hypothetical protein
VAYYNKAHVYIEDAGVISSDFLEISISDIDDGYKAEWTTIRTALVTKRECEDGIISCDCDEGSSDVRNLGTAIAAGGLFGCVPCAFVGGAIAALGAVGGLLCP